MKKILVAGGAGYIGSHVCKELHKRGYEPIVFDNLIYGHREFVKWGPFILGDLNNIEQIRLVFSEYAIDAVMHFAAFAYVGESVEHPKKYYINNVVATLNLLQVMGEFNVKTFIFSSTCATYGEPEYSPIDELHSQKPINPYGRSKVMVENILSDYHTAYGLQYISLRYFNASGADPDCEIGERHNPETHLIPLVLDAAMGRRPDIMVFGADYNTRDGSCIRDYIHVTDLAQAHIMSLEHVLATDRSDVFNLGNGCGYSVLEVIDCVKKVTQQEFDVRIVKRRAGDPPELVGSSKKIKSILQWEPRYSNLEDIIESAWRWHRKCHE